MREVNVSLRTRDDREAQLAYVKAHGEAEEYLQNLRRLAADPQTFSGTKEAGELGRAFLRQIRMPYVPLADLRAEINGSLGPTELEQRLNFVEEHLGIEVGDPETRDDEIAASWKARAILGDLPEQVFRISDALKVYLSERGPKLDRMSPKSAKRFKLISERIIRNLKEVLEEDKPFAEITRRNAIAFRDHLRGQKLAVSTVNKYMRLAATIWTVAARDIELAATNPFSNHAIADETPERDKRDVLTPMELSKLLARRDNMNANLGTMLILLAFTGARTWEIAGLCLDDVVDDVNTIPHLAIRRNAIRFLKTHSSQRNIPLLGTALQSVRTFIATRKDKSGPALFERYGRDGGNSAASADLMKHLRAAGIIGKTKVIHSLRHTIKQALRDVGCPVDVSNDIQGHTSGHVSESYGSGYNLKIMGEWLRKAYGEIGLL